MLVPAVGAAFLSGGCLITSGSETRITGAYVDREALFEIRPGETTGAQVEQKLGPPTSRSVLDDGAERLVYRWRRVTEGSGSVFLIFGGHSQREVVEQVAITVRDGVVETVERI
ncbi:MAG: hypothetical protein DHS20C14_18280 [Phycisphaeraceae bacterium]|nr:MAG: hypothetical protein DHS20C14_18280 [Phycisphaeraceae bacterium]